MTSNGPWPARQLITREHSLCIVPHLPYEDRVCTKCSSADIGDELHYVFSCPFLLLLLLNTEKISFTILL